MKQVLGHSSTLGLPIQPQASGTVMEVVSPDHYINGRVHLNSADFRAGQVLLVIDVVNVVILYDREHPSQMPYNTGLSAVMNIAAANHMGTDLLFVPAFVLSLTDAIPLRLCSIFEFDLRPLVVIFRLEIFSK